MFRYNPDNKVMQALSLYFDLIVLAFLWLISSLPIVTAGVSTTALHRVLGRLAGGDDVAHPARTYFGFWRSEWRQGTLVWLPLLGFLALTAGDLFICAAWRPAGLTGAVLWGGTFLAVWLGLCLLAYVFPVAARFECTVGQTYRNAVRFAVGSLRRTLAMAGILVLTGGAVYFLGAAAIFITGPLLYLRAKLLRQAFAPVVERFGAGREQEEVIYERQA